jgi:hypothetical protein
MVVYIPKSSVDGCVSSTNDWLGRRECLPTSPHETLSPESTPHLDGASEHSESAQTQSESQDVTATDGQTAGTGSHGGSEAGDKSGSDHTRAASPAAHHNPSSVTAPHRSQLLIGQDTRYFVAALPAFPALVTPRKL